MTMPSYRTCALAGPAIGIAAAALLATRAGLTPLLWIAIAAVAVCVAFTLAVATKVLFGAESFAFLHYQLATVAVTAIVHAPALDLLALALALAQAIGRLGCASAGCCHGHVGRVRVQYAESASLFVIAAVTAVTLDFAVYALAYAGTRFTLELFRDDARPHWLGVSEAQWICALTAVAVAAWRQGFAILVAAVLVLAIAAIAGRMRISHGVTAGVEHYTVSGIPRWRALRLARAANAQLVDGTARGVYHIVLRGAP